MADCSSQTLIDNAKCIQTCIPPGSQLPALIYLFCQMQDALSPVFGVEPANTVFAGPASGAAAVPTFRALVTADLGTTMTPQFTRVGVGVAADASNLLEIRSTLAGATFIDCSILPGPTTIFSVTATGRVLGTNYVGQATQIGALDIDWNGGTYFYKTLAANSTFTFSNVNEGQSITVILTNTASNFTVAWPSVRWAGGVSPVQTIGAKSDMYTFTRVNSITWGSYVQNLT